MGALEDLTQLVDDETTRIADLVIEQTREITELTDALADATAGSAEAEQLKQEVATAVGKLTGTADRLRSIGADPQNPVPPVEPEPEPLPNPIGE